jgi:Tfp pilus assembly protein PilF
LAKRKQQKGREASAATTQRIVKTAAPAAPETKWIALAIAAATIIVYWRASGFAFVPFDDNEYVYDNPVVLRGLTFDGLIWAFKGIHVANWHPLAWISHLFDVSLFGPNAGGHHVVSVLIHALSSSILFFALQRLTGAKWPSAIVAALFALHPLHVESVAWVSERKDVLSGLFWNLSLLIYAKYVRRKEATAYRWLLVVFGLALLSKQMVITLPFVLLLLDWWPLRRPLAWMEKLPMIGMTAIFSVIVFFAQREGPMAALTIPFPDRIQNAMLSYMRYLGRMFWPTSLTAFYPYPKSMPEPLVAVAAVVLIAVTAAAWWLRDKAPYFLVGWLWYLGTLVPVIGIIQVGQQSHADRYSYIPLVGIFIAIVWGVYDLVASKPALLRAAGVAAAVILLVLAAVTWHQVGYWRNGETLFAHALEVTQNNALAECNLGVSLNQQNRSSEAIPHFQRAVALDPRYTNAWVNLGNGLARNDRIPEAIKAWESALKIESGLPDVRNNLGVAYMRTRNIPQAMEQFKAAVAVDPNFVPGLVSLARIYGESGDQAQARAYWERVLAIEPENEQARRALGR